MYKIILASKSKVRKFILEKNNIKCSVVHSNVDEDPVKDNLMARGANPEIISKNLAELKANKVSQMEENQLVLGADSVIDLNGKLISKPIDRKDALRILKLLNGTPNIKGNYHGEIPKTHTRYGFQKLFYNKLK